MNGRFRLLVALATVTAGFSVASQVSGATPQKKGSEAQSRESSKPATDVPRATKVALRGAKPTQAPPAPRAIIEFYEAKLQEHPELFAGFAALSSAYLDMARETHAVTWLGKGRIAAARSLELQPNLSALATLAAINAFSHRFADALEFIERAERIRRNDEGLLALRVDALLGLGQLDAVDQLLQPLLRVEAPSFFALAARGRWFAEQERFDEAHDSFAAAANAARRDGNTDLVVWAETNAAGMYLDSDRPQLARPHLDAAAALPTSSWPTQAVLNVHWAELHTLEGRPEAALQLYESIVARQEDPELLRRAYVLARSLGNEPKAQALFAAAEQIAERAQAAGEILALESQARLYADAGVMLERAEQLAQQNLRHKRDRGAQQALGYVQERIAAARR